MQVNVCDIALNTGTILINRYEIQQIYYWGHSNILYLCHDLRTGKRVMIKEFCPYALCNRDMDGKTILCKGNRFESAFLSAKEAFNKECNIVKKLSDQDDYQTNHILKYRDAFTENRTIYFVTDLVEGMSLDEMVEKKIDFPKFKIMKSLTATIRFIHQCEILHLDIKPSNVIIMSNGDAVLIDFGAACYIGEKQKDTSFVSKGFSAPELYQGEIIGIETDLYSLGALFYYMLSGTVPTSADQRMKGEKLIDLSRMVTIPYPLEDSIMRALQLRTEKRFTNLALLEKILR